MENKINIAEILKYCPKGTKLYTPLFGEVTFDSIGIDEKYPIIVYKLDGMKSSFTEEGHYTEYPNSECALFPSSEMRDWTKFFKRGDVVWCKDDMYVIFEGWANDDYTKFNTTINFYVFDASFDKEVVCDTDSFVKASGEERAMFIANAEKHYNGKFNPDTLQVEPVKPKCQFKPFDKVLVRDNDSQEWAASFFSHYDENCLSNYYCIAIHYKQCIPYNEHTAHLIGTTDPYTEGGSE